MFVADIQHIKCFMTFWIRASLVRGCDINKNIYVHYLFCLFIFIFLSLLYFCVYCVFIVLYSYFFLHSLFIDCFQIVSTNNSCVISLVICNVLLLHEFA